MEAVFKQDSVRGSNMIRNVGKSTEDGQLHMEVEQEVSGNPNLYRIIPSLQAPAPLA